MRRLRLGWLCLLLLFAIALSGCWDRREVNDVAFLMVTGLDAGKQPGTMKARIHIAVPGKMGQTGPSGGGSQASGQFMKLEVEGKNLDKMRLELERQLSRDMDTSHRRVFLVGESLARKGVKQVLDEISRSAVNRLRAFFVVTKDISASELLDLAYPLEAYPAEALRELVARKHGAPTSLRDFFVASAMPGIEPVASAFVVPDRKHGRYALRAIAIFRDFRLVGFVEGEEAMLLNGLLGKRPVGAIKLRLPKVKGEFSVQMDELAAESTVTIGQEAPSFHFTIHATGHLTETTSNLDLTNPHYIEQLNTALNKKLEQGYQALLHKLQQTYKADSVGLGAMVNRQAPRYWKTIEKRWPDLYPKVEIRWQVVAKINDIGSTGTPLYLPEEEVEK